MVQHGLPEHPTSAGPLVPSRFPLSTPPAVPPEQTAWPLAQVAGPRPWGTRFAVPAIAEARHRKQRTHGVTKKETKYIDNGKEHTDSVDEPYEDEVDD